jgi:hypothetical protein
MRRLHRLLSREHGDGMFLLRDFGERVRLALEDGAPQQKRSRSWGGS